jgi:hypothetical protein
VRLGVTLAFVGLALVVALNTEAFWALTAVGLFLALTVAISGRDSEGSGGSG